MFGRIISWLKEVMNKMFGLRSETKITGGVPIAVSSEMAAAIQRWHDEYTGKAHWLKEPGSQSLNLPALIASEMATLVTLEAEVNITGSPRADFLSEQFKTFLENLHTVTEYACAMGGIVMKVYPDDGNIAIDYIHVDDFYPTAFNSRREIRSAAFVERKVIGDKVYSRVEYHSLDGTTYTITNKCFRGYTENDIGTEVPLSDVDEWADIQPISTIEGIDFPLFSYFRIPMGNAIDPKSPLGVSVYAKAENNIMEADKQYQRLLWEFEGGEMAIDVSENVYFEADQNRVILPTGKERLFRPNKLEINEGGSDIFKPYTPTLRDASLINGLNEILAKIEDQTGLARGTFSDRLRDTRTATEIKFSRQRTYATVTAIQMALEKAINGLVKAMDTIATLYNLAPAGEYQVVCTWDDSVVTDADTERTRDAQEVRDGLMRKHEFRMKWYGEDEKTARAAIQEQEQERSDDDILFKPTKE